MYPFGGLPLIRIRFQMIGNMDTLDNQHFPVFFNLTPRFRIEFSLTGRNFARFQRATKCSGQSAGSRGHHIIQGGGMGIVYFRIDPVMFCNFRMNTEHHR